MSQNSTVPTVDSLLLAWLSQHALTFANNRANIGLSQSYTTAFTQIAGNADKAWKEHQTAIEAAKAAAAAWRAAKDDARAKAAEGVRTIRNFASTAANPEQVYTLAEIPAPKKPNPGQEPGQPNGFKVALDIGTGNLNVTFKCENPGTSQGTVYTIARRPNSTAQWQSVGVTSVKKFTDTTIPAGTTTVQYMVTAQRGGIVGQPSLPVIVNFGHAGSGGQVASIVSGNFPSPSLAA